MRVANLQLNSSSIGQKVARCSIAWSTSALLSCDARVHEVSRDGTPACACDLHCDGDANLKTIYISQADPDFYFGTEVLKQTFPDAKVVATQATVGKIQATLSTKLQVWGPRLGLNSPKSVPLPEVVSGNTIALEGEILEIRGLSATRLRVDPIDQDRRRRRERVCRLAC
jgi:hypothetical protein